MGDFNDILVEDEKDGGRCKERRKVEAFKELLDSCQLLNGGYKWQKFTWMGIREGELVKERLDRVLVNLEWLLAFLKM